MIEKSLYENYEINFSDSYTTDDESYYFIYNNEKKLYLTESKELIHFKKDLDKFNINFILYIGKYKDKDAFVVNVKSNESFNTLYDIYEFNKDLYQIASRAVLVNDWYDSYRYCGHCGTKNILDDKDMMMKCPNCGQMHYPRIAPAIIVTISKGDKLLMAKHSYHNLDSYTLLAGFVEPGESIEDTVKREILEEVGIKIKNIQYLKSQTWPFPNSLMLGFKAEYDSGEIKVDGNEILDAKWFSKEEIIKYSSDISISSWLIDYFIENH